MKISAERSSMTNSGEKKSNHQETIRRKQATSRNKRADALALENIQDILLRNGTFRLANHKSNRIVNIKQSLFIGQLMWISQEEFNSMSLTHHLTCNAVFILKLETFLKDFHNMYRPIWPSSCVNINYFAHLVLFGLILVRSHECACVSLCVACVLLWVTEG
jgi:hypothetical protein